MFVGGSAVVAGVAPVGVVTGEPLEDRPACGGPVGVTVSVDEFSFEAGEERLGHRVVREAPHRPPTGPVLNRRRRRGACPRGIGCRGRKGTRSPRCGPARRGMNLADPGQVRVAGRRTRRAPAPPVIERLPTHARSPAAQHGRKPLGPPGSDPATAGQSPDSVTQTAVAPLSRSRSMRSCAFSRRSRVSSNRSPDLSPSRSLRSMRAAGPVAQTRHADPQRPSSRRDRAALIEHPSNSVCLELLGKRSSRTTRRQHRPRPLPFPQH